MNFKTMYLWLSLSTILLAIPVVDTRYSESSEVRLRDYLFNHPNYSIKARPVLQHETTVNVTIQMFLYAMIHFNEKNEVLTTASWTQVNWRDERLSWNPMDFDWLDILELKVEDVWTPNIVLSNTLATDSLRLISPDRGLITLHSTGDIYLSSLLIVSTQCTLRIKYFPFDTQLCGLTFSPENYERGQVDVTMENSTYPSFMTSLEWNLLGTTVANGKHPYIKAVFLIFLQRDPRYYISTIIVPSSVMCLLAIATFLSPPDCGERMSLGVSMVLGLTVFQLLVADTLPTSSKQSPILSNYLFVNFLMACATLPFSLFSINISYTGNRLTFMKKSWIRALLIKYLPYCMCLTSVGKMGRQEVAPISENANMNDGKVICSATPTRPGIFCADDIPLPRAAASSKADEENRVVAVVMDRIFFTCFLTLFMIVTIRALLEFYGKQDEDYIDTPHTQ